MFSPLRMGASRMSHSGSSNLRESSVLELKGQMSADAWKAHRKAHDGLDRVVLLSIELQTVQSTRDERKSATYRSGALVILKVVNLRMKRN